MRKFKRRLAEEMEKAGNKLPDDLIIAKLEQQVERLEQELKLKEQHIIAKNDSIIKRARERDDYKRLSERQLDTIELLKKELKDIRFTVKKNGDVKINGDLKIN